MHHRRGLQPQRMRCTWAWAVWNRRFYDADADLFIPEAAVTRISRRVHFVTPGMPHHLDCFGQIAKDICCANPPWFPRRPLSLH